MPIFFNVPFAREQLLRYGEVYTLRPKMRRTGKDIARVGSFYKFKTIGDVYITFVKKIDPLHWRKELKIYVEKSGAKTIEEWWKAGKGSEYLFHVKLVNSQVVNTEGESTMSGNGTLLDCDCPFQGTSAGKICCDIRVQRVRGTPAHAVTNYNSVEMWHMAKGGKNPDVTGGCRSSGK